MLQQEKEERAEIKFFEKETVSQSKEGNKHQRQGLRIHENSCFLGNLCARVHMPWDTCGGQKTTNRSWFSASTMSGCQAWQQVPLTDLASYHVSSFLGILTSENVPPQFNALKSHPNSMLFLHKSCHGQDVSHSNRNPN